MLTIKGSIFGSFTLGGAIDLLYTKRIKTAPLITQRFTLYNLVDAINAVRRRDSIKVVVYPD